MPCSARFLRSSSENWHSTLSEYLLQHASQPKRPPPGLAQPCETFRSLQAMVAVFKAGLRVRQMQTAMRSYFCTPSEIIAKARWDLRNYSFRMASPCSCPTHALRVRVEAISRPTG